MNIQPIKNTAFFITGLLCVLLVQITSADDFEVIFVTGQNVADLQIATHVLIDGGYTDGLEKGLTGEIYHFSNNWIAPEKRTKIANLTVDEVSAYASICRLSIIDTGTVRPGSRLCIDIPESTPEDDFEVAMMAFTEGDFLRAKHFFSRVLEHTPSDDNKSVKKQFNKCKKKLIEERQAPMTKEEIKREKAQIEVYLHMSLHYMYKINYEAADYYNEKVLKVERKNPDAKEISEIIKEKSRYLDQKKSRKKPAENNLNDDTLIIEVLPEMIHEEQPIYPNSAKLHGLHGVVSIRSLVDTEGEVIASKVETSSSFSILDIAALLASYKNKFNPATRNGVPIKCWVTYKVAFVM